MSSIIQPTNTNLSSMWKALWGEENILWWSPENTERQTICKMKNEVDRMDSRGQRKGKDQFRLWPTDFTLLRGSDEDQPWLSPGRNLETGAKTKPWLNQIILSFLALTEWPSVCVFHLGSNLTSPSTSRSLRILTQNQVLMLGCRQRVRMLVRTRWTFLKPSYGLQLCLHSSHIHRAQVL